MKKVIECGFCIQNDWYHEVDIYMGRLVNAEQYKEEYGKAPQCCDCGDDDPTILFECLLDVD